MCGIVAATANRNVTDIIVNGLKTLEYRGYDSAGIAINEKNHHISIRKQAGKLNKLIENLKIYPVLGHSGIGHTR